MSGTKTGTYTDAFYDLQRAGSLRSARAILPIVLDVLKPASVLDVGCGTGTWASVCGELGVDDFLGVDGDYVDRGRLLIPIDRFQPANLAEPLDLGRSFDL